ncbi:MAG: hypothetical protein VYC17_06125 [Nitrospinota bacterium]|nr:hypothetical protein [Nitrospinota bacterium]
MGILFALGGSIFGMNIVWYTLIYGTPVAGWSSLMIVVLVIGGMLMTMLGILGEYLWRAFDEARGRPRYVIEKISFSDKRSTKTKIKERP